MGVLHRFPAPTAARPLTYIRDQVQRMNSPCEDDEIGWSEDVCQLHIGRGSRWSEDDEEDDGF